MNLNEWALKWNIPPAALLDFYNTAGIDASLPAPSQQLDGHSEAYVQNLSRIAESRSGNLLWRNNVGALLDKTGRPVRYGLCNETQAMNENIKSSDLIGIKRVLITPQMVGQTIGQFFARECKHTAWQYSGDAHEQAQLKFGKIVLACGGDFAFTTGHEYVN